MTSLFRLLAAIAVAAAIFASPAAASAQGFTPQQRGEIEAIIRDYFIKHPEMIEELQALAQSEKIKRAIVENKEMLAELAAAGDARQSEGRRHDGRVLRLQLRLSANARSTT